MTIEIGNGPPPEIPLKKECWHKGCPNAADLQVGILMFGVIHGRKFPVEAETSVVVCSEHKKDITVADMVTDDGWAMIVEGFQKCRRLLPTRELTQLRFLPILKL